MLPEELIFKSVPSLGWLIGFISDKSASDSEAVSLHGSKLQVEVEVEVLPLKDVSVEESCESELEPLGDDSILSLKYYNYLFHRNKVTFF